MKGQIYLISSHCKPGLLQVHGEHTHDPFPPFGTEATYPVEDVTDAFWKVYASLKPYLVELVEGDYFRVPVDEAKRICERLLAPMSNPEADTSKG